MEAPRFSDATILTPPQNWGRGLSFEPTKIQGSPLAIYISVDRCWLQNTPSLRLRGDNHMHIFKTGLVMTHKQPCQWVLGVATEGTANASGISGAGQLPHHQGSIGSRTHNPR